MGFLLKYQQWGDATTLMGDPHRVLLTETHKGLFGAGKAPAEPCIRVEKIQLSDSRARQQELG